MAIKLVYYTIVIPITTVKAKFRGSWEDWCELNQDDTLGPSWEDGNLFARATMDPRVIEKIISKWEDLGFVGKAVVDGEERWMDFCLAETSARCDWLEYIEAPAAVLLVGSAPGEIISPKLAPAKVQSGWPGMVSPSYALVLAAFAATVIYFSR